MESGIHNIIEDLPWLQTKLANVELWLWFALPLLFLGSYILARLLISLFLLAAGALNLIERNWLKRYVFSVADALALLLSGIIFAGVQKFLPLPDAAIYKLTNFNATIYTVAIAWILIVYTNHTCELLRRRLLHEGRAASSALMPMLRKIANAAVLSLALLFLMQNWGFDVAALITALGIGGVAVALASQKSVESVLGGIIISLDQPIRVGDLGKFGDVTGTVEDIGLRSTLIRTDRRTIVSIPNADMATMRIENFSAREKLLFQKIIPLHPGTNAQQIQTLLAAVRDILKQHKLVEKETARACLVNFGTTSLDIEVTAQINTKIMDEYTKVQEELLLGFKKCAEEAGIELAYLRFEK